MSDKVLCPACGKEIAVKGIPKHTNGCLMWKTVIGVPPSQFNFDRHYKRKLWAEGLVEGVGFVSCPVCQVEGKDEYRALRLADHLKKIHKMSKQEFQGSYPDALIVAPVVYKKRSETVRSKYGVDNVFQAESIKEKSRETVRAEHGVDHQSQTPSAVTQRALTNLTRYGHENPFGGESIKNKIQETMTERHGAPNPQQCPDIRQKTLNTCKDLYGDEFFFRTEGFREKFKAASQERFGTDHPMQSDEGKRLWVSGCQEHLGVDNPLFDPVIYRKSYKTNLDNHGGKHSQQCPEVLEKAKVTWMEKYGVDNPAKAEEVKQKVKDTWVKNYGVPFPPNSMWSNRTLSFPNKLEQKVDAMSPVNVVYAGDGSYWIKHSGASRARNPDFVVLSAKQVKAWVDGADLNSLRSWGFIEVLGDYWHGPKVTGQNRDDHQREMIEYYKKCGVSCLVLWESDINKKPEITVKRIQRFLGFR